MPQASTIVSGVKLSFVATTLGVSVPYIQGILDTASKIAEYAHDMKSNRKQCKKIAALARDLERMLLEATDGVGEGQLSDRTRWKLAELHNKLNEISGAMAQMRKETFVRRLLSKDEHAETLSEHREALQDTMTQFQATQLICLDFKISRIEKKQDMVIDAIIWVDYPLEVLRDRILPQPDV